VVFVEQYVHVALAVADSASVVNRGGIVLEGPASELSSRTDELEQAYLGTFEAPTPTGPTASNNGSTA